MTSRSTGGNERVERRSRRWRVAAAVSLVVLAPACSAPGGAGDAEGSSTTSSASSTTSTTAVPGGSASGARTAYAIPASCGALRQDPGATNPGEAVATCWGEALDAHGSVRAWTNGPPEMEAELVLGPTPRLRTEASDGRVVVLEEGRSYGLLDGRWVRGVLNSEVEDEALVAATGEFAAVTFSPTGLVQGIGECPTWRVAPGRAAVTLHDGSEPSGLVRLDCAATFDVLGATTTEAALWVQEDWTPVRQDSTLSIGGASAESAKDFTDHGATFDIPTPTP